MRNHRLFFIVRRGNVIHNRTFNFLYCGFNGVFSNRLNISGNKICFEICIFDKLNVPL